jgi:hypothetical protein
VIKFWGYEFMGHVYYMLAPSWIKFNPGITYAGILNQQLDDANLNEDATDSINNPTDSSMKGSERKNEIR